MKKKLEKRHISLTHAQKYLASENYKMAVLSFSKLIQTTPNLSAAQFGLGDSYFGQGDYDRAETAYRSGLKLSPLSPDGLYSLAATLRVKEQYEESIDVYKQAIDVEPDRFEAYWELAYSLEMSGNIEEAEGAYKICLTHYPDHGMAKHLLSAMTCTNTDRAPDEYIRDLFDDYADSFENDLVNDLNYVVPDLIKTELGQILIKFKQWNNLFPKALDLGCGTGLVSAAIIEFVKTIDGVDLSEKMISLAVEHGRYSRTYVQEITSFLFDFKSGFPRYDLIVCGDALVYLGDLEAFFEGIARRLSFNGVFCFTLEDLPNGTYMIRRSGRYAHSKSYIKRLSKQYGFDSLTTKFMVPRTDGSKNIKGRLYTAIYTKHP